MCYFDDESFGFLFFQCKELISYIAKMRYWHRATLSLQNTIFITFDITAGFTDRYIRGMYMVSYTIDAAGRRLELFRKYSSRYHVPQQFRHFEFTWDKHVKA